MSYYGKHILCVDDHRDSCEILKVAYPEIRFTFSHTYADGIAQIRNGIFDLYLLDCWLPDGSGVDLCREIRGNDADTPIVFLSAAASDSDHDKALAAGATAYLDKPVALLQLESTVTCLIRRSELRSLRARVAEIHAVQAAITDYLGQVNGHQEENRESAIRGREHMFRAQAYAAFIRSGGVRSRFEELWHGVFSAIASGTTESIYQGRSFGSRQSPGGLSR